MCGIAGLVGRPAPDRLRAMLDTLVHRGPDDEGQVWVEAGDTAVGLGNRRLSILDLSAAGHLPMRAGDDVLAYNGELYEWQRLRDELTAGGVAFRTGSDAEVVLALLRRDGSAALRRLNGMFALAYWDSGRQELLLARDRFGQKPLYWCRQGAELLFASEAKALFAGGAAASFDPGALGGYLSFGWVPGSDTLFAGVQQLPPGHLLRWRGGVVKVEAFHDLAPDPRPVSPEVAAEQLRERLADAVTRQLVADVPVGVLFSGGLDSTAIAALAARVTDHQLTAYTITCRGADAETREAEDAPYARRAAAQLGLQLVEVETSAPSAELLNRVAWHLDDPVADPAAFLSLLIAERARPDVKVLLAGQGADELYGGYRQNLYDPLATRAARAPQWLRRTAVAGLGLGARVPHRTVSAGSRAVREIVRFAGDSPEDRYVAWRQEPYFRGAALTSVLSADMRAAVRTERISAAHLAAFAAHPEADFTDRMLTTEAQTYRSAEKRP